MSFIFAIARSRIAQSAHLRQVPASCVADAGSTDGRLSRIKAKTRSVP